MRRALLLGSAATLLAVSSSGTGWAQDDEEDDEGLDQVIITGSRIPRADLVANSPINVVDAEEFELAGNATVERVLNQLPQVVPTASSQSNNPGAGFATIDLRGLGNQRTLILVNGRRWIPADNSAGFGGSDVNTIPSAMVERVDVVTGGASAVYGSDAMAGVVNFILKDDFEGLEVGSQFDITEKGDGESWQIYTLAGTNFADGRGNITVFMEYYTQADIQARDRVFTFFDCDDGNPDPNEPDERGDLATRGEFTCGAPGPTSDGLDILRRGGSSRIPEGRLSGGGFDVGPPAGRVGSILFEQDGTVRPRSSVTDVFNFAPFTNIQIPLERWSISTDTTYEITEGIRFYAEGTFVNSRSDGRLAPTPLAEALSISVDDNPATTAIEGNPFLTDQAKAVIRTSNNYDATTGEWRGSLFRRMLESGDRVENFTTNAYRFVAGFEGEFGNGWNWDTYYMFARTELTDLQEGNIQLSRAQQSLLLEQDDDGNFVCQDTSGGCIPVNFFGEGNVTPEMANFITINSLAVGNVQQQVASASVTGDLIEGPAGPLQFAFGGEWRADGATFTPDPVAASGDIDGFNAAGDPLDGSFNVWEVFSEFYAPVLRDKSFAQLISLEGGLRWSNYSTAGTVWTFKGGGEWQVIDDIRFRGLFQRAVRAPNINELFGPQVNGFPGVDDFCDANQMPVANGLGDLCIATGVPAAFFEGTESTFEQEDPQVEATLGGNPNLTEERTNTWTIGAVITPTAVPGLSLTLDWYNIRLDGAISQFGGSVQGIFDLCAQANDINNEFCQAVAAGRRADGNTEGILSLNENVSAFETRGLDVSLNYEFEMGNIANWLAGNMNINSAFTYVDTFTVFPTDISEPVECAGKFGGDCGQTFSGYPTPDKRAVTRFTWSRDALQVSLRWRWTAKLEDTNESAAITEVGGQHYFDITGTYDITDTVQVRLGVENLTSNRPPRVGNSQTDANTLVPLFDVLGARFFAGVRANF